MDGSTTPDASAPVTDLASDGWAGIAAGYQSIGSGLGAGLGSGAVQGALDAASPLVPFLVIGAAALFFALLAHR